MSRFVEALTFGASKTPIYAPVGTEGIVDVYHRVGSSLTMAPLIVSKNAIPTNTNAYRDHLITKGVNATEAQTRANHATNGHSLYVGIAKETGKHCLIALKTGTSHSAIKNGSLYKLSRTHSSEMLAATLKIAQDLLVKQFTPTPLIKILELYCGVKVELLEWMNDDDTGKLISSPVQLTSAYLETNRDQAWAYVCFNAANASSYAKYDKLWVRMKANHLFGPGHHSILLGNPDFPIDANDLKNDFVIHPSIAGTTYDDLASSYNTKISIENYGVYKRTENWTVRAAYGTFASMADHSDMASAIAAFDAIWPTDLSSITQGGWHPNVITSQRIGFIYGLPEFAEMVVLEGDFVNVSDAEHDAVTFTPNFIKQQILGANTARIFDTVGLDATQAASVATALDGIKSTDVLIFSSEFNFDHERQLRMSETQMNVRTTAAGSTLADIVLESPVFTEDVGPDRSIIELEYLYDGFMRNGDRKGVHFVTLNASSVVELTGLWKKITATRLGDATSGYSYSVTQNGAPIDLATASAALALGATVAHAGSSTADLFAVEYLGYDSWAAFSDALNVTNPGWQVSLEERGLSDMGSFTSSDEDGHSRARVVMLGSDRQNLSYMGPSALLSPLSIRIMVPEGMDVPKTFWELGSA